MVPHSIFHAVVVMVINQDTAAWTAAKTGIENESIGGCKDKSFTYLKDTSMFKKSIEYGAASKEGSVKLTCDFVFPLGILGVFSHTGKGTQNQFSMSGLGLSAAPKFWPISDGKVSQVGVSHQRSALCREKTQKCCAVHFPINWGCCYLWKLERFILLPQQFLHGKEQLQTQAFI